jgi:hypothetical protein
MHTTTGILEISITRVFPGLSHSCSELFVEWGLTAAAENRDGCQHQQSFVSGVDSGRNVWTGARGKSFL